MITQLIFAACDLLCLAVGALLAHRWHAPERRRVAHLEALLSARIDSEDAAVAQSYCLGWTERGQFEECVREQASEAVRQHVKGFAN